MCSVHIVSLYTGNTGAPYVQFLETEKYKNPHEDGFVTLQVLDEGPQLAKKSVEKQIGTHNKQQIIL